MTSPQDEMVALAARCEAATGPDRELDRSIREALEPHADRSWQNRQWGTPSFTASLDAAMTLVPEGALWKVDHGIAWSDEQPASEGRNYRAGVGVGDVPAKWSEGISASTPALALCAAALKARASQPEQGD